MTALESNFAKNLLTLNTFITTLNTILAKKHL